MSSVSPEVVGAVFVIAFFAVAIAVGFAVIWRRKKKNQRKVAAAASASVADIESLPSQPTATYSQLGRPSRPQHPAYDPSINADIRGVGRFGYVPREAELHRQRNDQSREAKVDGLTRFIVGRRVAENFETKTTYAGSVGWNEMSEKSGNKQSGILRWLKFR